MLQFPSSFSNAPWSLSCLKSFAYAVPGGWEWCEVIHPSYRPVCSSVCPFGLNSKKAGTISVLFIIVSPAPTQNLFEGSANKYLIIEWMNEWSHYLNLPLNCELSEERDYNLLCSKCQAQHLPAIQQIYIECLLCETHRLSTDMSKNGHGFCPCALLLWKGERHLSSNPTTKCKLQQREVPTTQKYMEGVGRACNRLPSWEAVLALEF